MKILTRLFLGVFLLSSIACQASSSDQPFGVFWTEFRAAVLTENYTALKKFTKLPLKVRGVDDETPSVFYAQDKIQEIFPQLLDQIIYNYEGEELEESSFRELIKKRETATAEPGEKFYRIDQFEFQNINGRWVLVRAYLE